MRDHANVLNSSADGLEHAQTARIRARHPLGEFRRSCALSSGNQRLGVVIDSFVNQGYSEMRGRRSGRTSVIHRARAALFCAGLLGPGTAMPDEPVSTVCTITVNSADERDVLARLLPPRRYRFVELVEHGRSDWLALACRRAVSCDVLVVSGHYDGRNAFFSDRPESAEHLTATALERASCSGACPGLFAQLREVYLFGCNTLNELPQHAAAQDSRSRMRLIFKDVPAIYGFASSAPLGPHAAESLERYLGKAGGDLVFGSGRKSPSLLAQFAPHAMSVTAGIREGDPDSGMRRDLCTFADDRVTSARQVAFVHQVLRRHPGQALRYLDRLESTLAAIDATQRKQADVAKQLDAIADDVPTRQRFLDDASAAVA
jgi:hypothetical protein